MLLGPSDVQYLPFRYRPELRDAKIEYDKIKCTSRDDPRETDNEGQDKSRMHRATSCIVED